MALAPVRASCMNSQQACRKTGQLFEGSDPGSTGVVKKLRKLNSLNNLQLGDIISEEAEARMPVARRMLFFPDVFETDGTKRGDEKRRLTRRTFDPRDQTRTISITSHEQASFSLAVPGSLGGSRAFF
jgi:hypothetical protein